MSAKRVLIVSNRLPITLKRDNDNQWVYSVSSGGLVSALSSLKKLVSFTWIGWPGVEVCEDERTEMNKTLYESYSCIPIYIPEEVADLHYNGFSNSILWPLFHYLPGEVEFNKEMYKAYYAANQAFAKVIVNVAADGDLIWIHDYHLMLLPALLRNLLDPSIKVKIGFFLHTPFPSSEIYRVLPVSKDILTSLLSSDLIGFHAYDYARHFSNSCSRLLALPIQSDSVQFKDRHVRIGTYPIGIDPTNFLAGLKSPAVIAKIEELSSKFAGMKIIVGIDRLDYIKGVPHKLYAFELFLTKYPEYQGKSVLVQVGVPTRTDVMEYKNLRATVNEHVGQINGKFGNLEYIPVHFLNQSISFEELLALYYVGDICLVTSTRDGMNLVSYEYVSCQKDRGGVLILSEFAGAAQSMNGATIVNPWNLDEVADAIYQTFETPLNRRIANNNKLFKYVSKYTAAFWGESFIGDLERLELRSKATNSIRNLTLEELDTIVKSGKNLYLVTDDQNMGKIISQHRVFRNTFVVTQENGTIMINSSSNDHDDEERSFQDWLITSATKDDAIEETKLTDAQSLLVEMGKPVPGMQVYIEKSVLVLDYKNAELDSGKDRAAQIKLHLEQVGNYAIEHVEEAMRLYIKCDNSTKNIQSMSLFFLKHILPPAIIFNVCELEELVASIKHMNAKENHGIRGINIATTTQQSASDFFTTSKDVFIKMLDTVFANSE